RRPTYALEAQIAEDIWTGARHFFQSSLLPGMKAVEFLAKRRGLAQHESLTRAVNEVPVAFETACRLGTRRGGRTGVSPDLVAAWEDVKRLTLSSAVHHLLDNVPPPPSAETTRGGGCLLERFLPAVVVQ